MTEIPFPFLCIFLLFIVSADSQSLESQRSILLAIKQEWGNPPSLSSWNATTSPCSWQEITCSATDAVVTGVALSNANITSRIPTSLCDLKNLTNLDLSMNYVPGEFPTELYNCSSLAYLNLSYNNFVGRIPDDVDRLAPSSLRHIDLSANNFTGDVPRSIGRLKELRSLNLLYNLLNGTFPSEIGNLSELQDLQLAYNPFTPMALPSEWGKLKQLQFLFMRECNLVGEIPQSFGGLESLQHLDLVGNEVVALEGEIPSGLFLLKDLTYVYLYKNNLSGEIPSVVQSLNLTEIDLSLNNLSGSIPQDFGKLKQLRILNLFNNKLDGEIPASIGLLPELEYLKVFYNNLSGVLPTELGLHSYLKELQIGGNRFSGPLPQNLCSKGAFRGLTAFSNGLTGEIPKSLESCTTLRNLMLENNNLTGEIPRGIWSLPNIYTCQLSFNGFMGQLPDHIPRNLTRLELNNNKLSGNIPAGVATWTNIHVFNAGNNFLSGTIPLGLTSLPNLLSLSLEGNQLSGPLPTKVNTWASLSSLKLGGNRLFGSIPSTFGTLSTLNYLDLSSNDLSGEIPFELGNLKLSFLNLSNNQLTGEIPYSLENQAYSNSFLNNTGGLCTSDGTQISSLPKCSAKTSTTNKHTSNKYLTLILVLAVLILLVGLYLIFFMFKEMRQRKGGSKVAAWKLTSFQRLEFTESSILSSLCEQNVIGSGGSGKVYRVPITSTSHSPGRVVAVKKIWNNETESQFLAEVQILGTIRHSNIVKLLCCVTCDDDNGTKLLVYEYLANQSLDRWLHQKTNRDYRYTNKVRETAADVYSFGVVLLELVTGKEANGDGSLNLAESSWKHYKDGKPMEEAVDEELKQQQQPIGESHVLLHEIGNVYKLGLMCTSASPTSRPTMKEVLQMLHRFSPNNNNGDHVVVVDINANPKTERDAAPLLSLTANKISRSKRLDHPHFSMV
ncbi:hypothetical protein V2J09_022794 [Rumex salicifolius]